mmetsp:Transcript_28450/g.45827  ORF Transcript_28450/g.45827 Transcript_28450/m.45827 type:complete len:572 (+) Transcript_28450:1237-2952(+)|eukprot:CAMPEP_0203758974 /NCGR_PEP_ID=MMETSP0098-20131031/11886_1 /ASSEMBLY_ACC=CAM_ASM_000208 /TAXON_ID=96639 /ORGANISM=" , Strain NY0313808BC1" /LENGTH=571 /DNA_ID=CAMNT_0050651677 /DNA_START=632 /DNA_END=2347 /DNA_ORIENTATION=+
MYSDRSFQKIDVESHVKIPQERDYAEEGLDGVCQREQLDNISQQYLSGNPKRPLKFVDNVGNEYTYVLKPFLYAVVLILLLELFERLAFYGISFTMVQYLTGVYSEWSANLGDVQAVTIVQSSTGIAYSAPFIGAIICDGFLGPYWTIILFVALVYIPGLGLLALSAYPYGVSDTFPLILVTVGYTALYSIGSGCMKVCISVMGASQMHPIHQKKQVESFFISYYMFINMGGLIGGLTIPVFCQHGAMAVFYSYLTPFVCLTLGLVVFVVGTPRYVRPKAQGSAILDSVKYGMSSLLSCCKKNSQTVQVENGAVQGDKFFGDKLKIMGYLFVLMLLTVPFNIVYSQMLSVFASQGKNMNKALGFIDGAFLQNFDVFSVLIFGFLIGTYLHPFLERKGLKMHPIHKIGAGTALATLAIAWAIGVDYWIHSHYASTGGKLSTLLLVPSFILIGAGEIFALATAYEMGFSLSPIGFKGFGSAINLFCLGGVPNFIAAAIVNACNSFFLSSNGDSKLDTIQLYSEAHLYKYFFVLLGICVFALVVIFMPFTRKFYDHVETKVARIAEAGGQDPQV